MSGRTGRLLILGAGDHARCVAEAARASGRWDVAGLVAPGGRRGERVAGLPMLGTEEELGELTGGVDAAVVAIGDNDTRLAQARRALERAPGLVFGVVVHPFSAVAWGVELGAGTVVLAGVVVGPGSKVGGHCLLNTGSSLDHDGVMEEGSSLGPGAVLGGRVRVGAGAAVCLGAKVIHRRTIGSHSVVGAGAVVVRDIPAGVVAVGVPARAVRERRVGERYL